MRIGYSSEGRHSTKLFAFLLLLIAGIVGVVSTAQALSLGLPVHAYRLDRWYSDEGLPHNTVHSLTVSPEGYLWVATWEGLARFNGKRFQRYNARTIDVLKGDGFRAVLSTPDGSIWGGTAREGVVVRRGQQWQRYTTANGLRTNNMFVLEHDLRDGIWVGTQDGGASHINADGSVSNLSTADGLHADWVQCFKVESDGSVWIGTARGLNLYANKKVQDAGAGLPSGVPIYAVIRDRIGRLWVGAETGLYYFERERFQRFASGGIDLRGISSLMQDRDGALWIGTLSQGIFRFSERGLEPLTTADGLTNNRITGIREDHEGGIWVATNGGLNRVSATTFSSITRNQGLRDEFVRSVHEGKDAVWVGTSQGLYQYQDRSVTQPGFLKELAGASIMSVFERSNGELWVGTYDAGIARFDGQRWSYLKREQGLPSNQVRAIFEADDGSMWVGTSQGVWLEQGTSSKVYSATESMPTDYTLGFAQLRDGSIMIGTARGFTQLRDDKLTSFKQSSGFPGTDTFAFLEDLSGTVWIGTYEGLVRWRDGKFTHFGRRFGLPETAVFSIHDSPQGELLLSTNHGLIKIARTDLDRESSNTAFTAFGRADGMAGTQINGSSQPSSWRTRSGELYLPTARGVSVLNLAEKSELPSGSVPTVIESLAVDGGEYGVDGSTVNVEAGKRRIRLDYIGLSYTYASRLRYRYRLLGFDPEWVEAGAETSAGFTNLSPGRYTFEVQADYGDFSAARASSVSFRIEPFIYQTTWFWGALALLAAAAIIGLHRLRLHSLRVRERVLEGEIAARTAELTVQNRSLEVANQEKSALLNTIQMQAQAFARQAREDALTGLANRRHFDLLIAREFSRRHAQQEPLWVAIADLDHFKRINDQHGHQAGDDVLRAVAAVLERQCEGAGVVARFGGEEFAFYFASTVRTQVLDRLEAMRQEISALQLDAYPGLTISISVGVNRMGEATHFEKLLADADACLYQAKAEGRNRVVS